MTQPSTFITPLGVQRKSTKAWCEAEIAWALQKIEANMRSFGRDFPGPVGEGNVFHSGANDYWTTSFWTGQVWLAYELTQDRQFLDLALAHVDSFDDRLKRRVATDTHDLGFLYSLSTLVASELTGSTQAKRVTLEAADLLMTRYFDRAGIIQAWGDLSDPAERGRMIIDCCMNLPLLYWASRVTGKDSYARAAWQHAQRASTYLVREDSSTFHTYYMDTETGEPRFGRTCQGYSDSSCWSRGQAWAIYGFALSYQHTGDLSFIQVGKRVADYFLAHLPADHICYWDLIFTSGPEERDSSAAAIAACGLLELARVLPITDPDRERYEQAAEAMVMTLAKTYTSRSLPGSNALLLHSVYDKGKGRGVDECTQWGDYFYLEALVRISRSWRPYWSF